MPLFYPYQQTGLATMRRISFHLPSCNRSAWTMTSYASRYNGRNSAEQVRGWANRALSSPSRSPWLVKKPICPAALNKEFKKTARISKSFYSGSPMTSGEQPLKKSSYPELPHHPPPGFRVRDAELADVESLTRIWYASFNASHAFFNHATPDDAATRKWFDEFWAMGIEAGPDVMRTFVVEDLSQGNKLVALSKWHVPQSDGNQHIPMPPFPGHWDVEVADALWGGMARSRARIMGQKTHWLGEMIGVDQAYHRKGLAFALMDWGIRQADAMNLEIQGDATHMGLPTWKYCGFEERPGAFVMPDRPGFYETFKMVPVVYSPNTRPVRKTAKP